jgi:hypothetical protein
VTLFVLFIVGMVDIALYLTFDEHSDLLRCLPGQQEAVMGKLPEALDNVNILPRSDDAAEEVRRVALLNDKVLAQQADVPGLSIRFEELRGRMWRGELAVGEGTAPGQHKVMVFPRETLNPEAPPVAPSLVHVAVFASPAAMRQSYVSLSERYLGFGPWWMIAAIVPLAALLLLYNFRRSAVEDAVLQARGMGPIYKLAKAKDHWDMLFGLGTIHGVREGENLALLNRQRQRVGTVTAREVKADSASARLDPEADVSPFHLVAKVEGKQENES